MTEAISTLGPPATDPDTTCPQCGNTFKSKAGMASHLSLKHRLSLDGTPIQRNRRTGRPGGISVTVKLGNRDIDFHISRQEAEELLAAHADEAIRGLIP